MAPRASFRGLLALLALWVSFAAFPVAAADPLTINIVYTISMAGEPFVLFVVPTGGTMPYRFFVASGALPKGVTLNTLTGQVRGTPEAAGKYTVVFRVTDDAGQSATKSYTFIVDGPPLDVTPATNVAEGSVGVPMSFSPYTVKAGVPPYQFFFATLAVPGVPPGLRISQVTGVISGVPTEQGSFLFNILIKDSVTQVVRQVRVNVSPQIRFNIDALPKGIVNVPYSVNIPIVGGNPPFTLSLLAGSLPPGLKLENSAISGVPQLPGGDYPFALKVVDQAGVALGALASIQISAPGIVTQALDPGTVRNVYSQQLAATGGMAPYKFSLASGKLPEGLTLADSGLISGTPTVAGTFSLAIAVTDDARTTVQRTLPLTINDSGKALAVSGATNVNITIGALYSQTIAATGGKSPYRFTLASGRLPDDIKLDPTGILSGTAKTAGTFRFTLEVTDATSAKASLEFTFTVAAPRSPPAVTRNGVVNAASFRPVIAPGSWVTITGQNLGPATPRQWKDSEIVDGRLPVSLDGVSVKINNKPAYVFYISRTQLNVLAPDDATSGPVVVEVTTPDGVSRSTAELRSLAPALFTLAGGKYVAAVGAEGAFLGPEGRKAKPGEVILLFGTGFGVTDPPQPTGQIPAPSPLTAPVGVTIGGEPAKVLFAGLVAPGLYQFNVEVPEIPDGDQGVVIATVGAETQADIILSVQR